MVKRHINPVTGGGGDRPRTLLHAMHDDDTPVVEKNAMARRLKTALSGAIAENTAFRNPVDALYGSEPESEFPVQPATRDEQNLFIQDLRGILEPQYGTPEWIDDARKLFSDSSTPVFHPSKPKTFRQKLAPIKPGRHAEEIAPGRLKRTVRMLGTIVSSLMVTEASFSESMGLARTNQQTLPVKRTEAPTVNREKTWQERRKQKNLRAVGAMVVATTVLAGVFAPSLMKRDASPESDAPNRAPKATATYSPNIQQDILHTAELSNGLIGSADTIAHSGSRFAGEFQAEVSAPAHTDFTITIQPGGNIWQATKKELQKSNPGVTNQEVADVVNRIILGNNLNTPNLVYAGNTFTVSH